MNVQIVPPPSNKNYAIEAFRFIFICIICLWHCRDAAPWLCHGYIAVEFYFVLSGFFIFQSYRRHQNLGVLDFTWRKIKKFYIPFFISVVLLMALDRKQYFYCHDLSADGILITYFSHFHEFFFCQCLGLTDKIAINHPLWFMSILIFGGGILYSLLHNFNQKAISLYIPLICLWGFPFILDNGNHAFQNQMNLFGIQSWMIRGVADMGLGVLTAYILQVKFESFNRNKILVNSLGVISLFGLFLMTLAKENYDYLAIIFVPLIICSSFVFSSWFKRLFRGDVWGKLGELSMYMYFIHLFVASVYWILKGKIEFLCYIQSGLLLILYLLAVVISAWLLKIVSEKIYNIFVG